TIGVWCSYVALKHTSAGIAATIIATLPIMVLPVVMIVYKEKITWRALVGTLLAVCGVALLFLR
ncbi:MAG TPA: EamA family transporter, partial [bacterium]|nr:EamA family transporter [bacterium]